MAVVKCGIKEIGLWEVAVQRDCTILDSCPKSVVDVDRLEREIETVTE